MNVFWSLITLLLWKFCSCEVDRKPVWNIAHMVNALYQVDYYLDLGANSIEFDVAFDTDGSALYTYHGIPCDCFRSCLRYETFDNFLEYLARLTTPGDPFFRKELVLLMFDLKVSGLGWVASMRAGEDLARKLLNLYWEGAEKNAYLLISMPSIVNVNNVIRSFKETLVEQNATKYLDKVGFDFSGNEDLDLINDVLDSNEVAVGHVWQGDGITNCLPRGTSRLIDALGRRDQQSTYPNKVYWWTVDRMATMRRTLRLGVDALITNHPERLRSVLEEDGFNRTHRLATERDNPWASSLSSRMMRLHDSTLAYDPEELLYNT